MRLRGFSPASVPVLSFLGSPDGYVIGGLPGRAGTVTVGSTTTGNAGSSASVTNSGTSNAAVLNFIVPRGDTGATGATGPVGPIGLTGNAATATVGSTSTGLPGSSAVVSNSGTVNAAVLDFTIPRGDVGPQGAPGTPGSVTVAGLGDATTISRFVCITASGGVGAADGANTWAKLATLSSGNFNDCQIVLAVASSNVHLESATIAVTLRGAADGAVPPASISMLSKSGAALLAADAFKLVGNAASGGVASVGLWVRKSITYGRMNVYELSRSITGGSPAITYHATAPWQAAEPVGTAVNVSTNGVTAFGLPVVTGTATKSGTAIRGPVVNTPVNVGWVSGLHNDLASLTERGGSIVFTKNGVVQASPASALHTGAGFPYITGSLATDEWVYEVTYPSVDWPYNDSAVIGIHLYQQVPDVKIDIFRSGGWFTVYDVTGASADYIHWVRPAPFTGTTKLRFTIKNHVGNLRVKEIFSVNDVGFGIGPRAGLTSSVMFRNGGSLYGSTAAPANFQAAGIDANIDLDLRSKGSGVVEANGLPVATTTGAQTITNKTISGASNTLSAIPQTAVTDLSGSLRALMPSGDNSIPSGNMEVAGLLQRPTFVSTEQFRSGTQSFKTVGHTWSTFPATVAEMPLVNAGEVVYGDVWVYAPTGQATTAQQVVLRIDFYNSSGTSFNQNYIALNATTALNGVWTNIAGSAVAPAGSVRYCMTLISLQLGGTEHPTHVYYWDDLRAKIMVGRVAVPASPTSPGVVGQWAAEAAWHYVCTATNTWRRAALSTW